MGDEKGREELPPLETDEEGHGLEACHRSPGDDVPHRQAANLERIKREARMLNEVCEAEKLRLKEVEAEEEQRQMSILEQVRQRRQEMEESRRKYNLEQQVLKIIPALKQHLDVKTGNKPSMQRRKTQMANDRRVQEDEENHPPEKAEPPFVDEESEDEGELRFSEDDEARTARMDALRQMICKEEKRRFDEERVGRIAARRQREVERREVAARNEARSQQSEVDSSDLRFNIPGMKCPKNHPVVPYIKRVSGPCDECKDNIVKGVHVMACSFAPMCDWFLCRRCCEQWEREA